MPLPKGFDATIRRRTNSKQVIRPTESFACTIASLQLVVQHQHTARPLSATPTLRPSERKQTLQQFTTQGIVLPGSLSYNTRTMSPTRAATTSLGGGGQVAAGSSLRVYQQQQQQQQQQQGSSFDVNSRDPSSTHIHNRTGIPQTHKKECGMTFCDNEFDGDRAARYCHMCPSNPFCRRCRLHIESLPSPLFEHARLVTGIDLVLCHSCVVWAYRDKPPNVGDSIPACLSPLFRPAAAAAAAAATAAEAPAKATKPTKATKVSAGTRTLGSLTAGLQNTAGVSKDSGDKRCGAQQNGAASRATSGAAGGAAGRAAGGAAGGASGAAEKTEKKDRANGADRVVGECRGNRADSAGRAAGGGGASPGSAVPRSPGPGPELPALSLTHREQKWLGLSQRMLPVSTLPSIATYGEDGAKGAATTTTVTVAAVTAIAAAAAAVEAAVEKGEKYEKVEVESEGETDAEATSPFSSSAATCISATSNNRDRSWKRIRSPSARKLLERDGERRTLVKAKLALERHVSQQRAANGCPARVEHAERAGHAGRPERPERPERTGYARHAERGAGAVAGAGSREHATLHPQSAAPSARAAAAADGASRNGTEEEAATASQPARARRTHGLVYRPSRTRSGRSDARVAEEGASAGRGGAGAGRSRRNRAMLLPATPERRARLGHERAAKEERCCRDKQKSVKGGGGVFHVMREAVGGCGALGFGVVGLGVGFGIGVAVGAALVRGRR